MRPPPPLSLSPSPVLLLSLSMVNKAVVDYFFVELSVKKHFEALRHFLLMEDGEFALSLTDRLFEKVRAEHQLATSLKRPHLEHDPGEGRRFLFSIL